MFVGPERSLPDRAPDPPRTLHPQTAEQRLARDLLQMDRSVFAMRMRSSVVEISG
jgi:hypothetical protein